MRYNVTVTPEVYATLLGYDGIYWTTDMAETREFMWECWISFYNY